MVISMLINVGLTGFITIISKASCRTMYWPFKRTFSTLREIIVHSVKDIVLTIISGCILHNLCILHEDHIDDFIEYDDDALPNNYVNIFANAALGTDRRNEIIQRLP
ncbi:hypothetical protein KUTeg_022201 [Tegillarca granosa]|uniref:DDE Tnp4 domain-containing protein n=1 Tax=Tegillarca granosa TaxID=220873 RepID=A0ABQ9E5X3_TEGGR|nr:hypothetical protein KUTeg_022201 [Tegillarca granosa]